MYQKILFIEELDRSQFSKYLKIGGLLYMLIISQCAEVQM